MRLKYTDTAIIAAQNTIAPILKNIFDISNAQKLNNRDRRFAAVINQASAGSSAGGVSSGTGVGGVVSSGVGVGGSVSSVSEGVGVISSGGVEGVGEMSSGGVEGVGEISPVGPGVGVTVPEGVGDTEGVGVGDALYDVEPPARSG